MKKKLLFWKMILFSIIFFVYQDAGAQITIGTGTLTTERYPIYAFFGYTYSQSIYLQSEINAAGQVTKISYYFTGTSLTNSNNWTIYLGHTTKTEFASTTDWVPLADLTPVYSGTFTSPTGPGWIEFDVSGFTYNNVDNLVIAVDENTPSYNGNGDRFYNSTVTENRSMLYYSDSTNPDPNAPPTASERKAVIPNVILEIGAPPTCPKPTSLTVTNITGDAATLGWTAGGTETTWNIEWGPFGFTQGMGNMEVATSNSFNLSGLNPSTAYSFYVQADCGGGDLSNWSGPQNFMTSQIPATLPFTEDFEAFPADWTIENGTQVNKWEHGSATAYNGTQSLYISNDGGTTNAYTVTSTSVVHAYRDIQFTNGLQFNLSFWYKGQGEGVTTFYDYLRVYLIDPSTTPVAGTQLSTGQIGATYNLKADWTLVNLTIDGASVANQVKRLVFSWRNDGSVGTQPPIAIDDIEIIELTCPNPTNLTATNVTDVSADLGWTAGGTETSWNIEWGTVGFTLGTGTLETASSNSFSLTGLTPSTSYSFYVQADCGGAGMSAWIGPYTFTTTCGIVSDFTENFDAVTTPNLPNCWNKVGTSGTINTQTTNPASAPNCLYIYSSSSTAKATLAMPVVNNAGAGTHQLRFKLRANFTVGGVIEVGYLTDRNDANTFVPVTSFTASTLTYDEKVAMLGTAPGSNNSLAFRHTGVPANSVLIDDVVWEPLPSCPPVSNLTATNITSNSADLGWTVNGTETTWNIEWGTFGFTQGTGNMEIATSNPFNLSGLNASTQYSFYVQADCGGDLSSWVGPFNFTTACDAINIPYSQDFESVTVPAIPICHTVQNAGTGNNWVTANNPGAGFTTKVLKYGFNSSNAANAWFFTPGINLDGGTSYRLSFNYGNNSTTYTEKMKVMYGNSADYSAMTTLIIDYPTINQNAPQLAEIDFSPTNSGVYYIGFNVYSAANQYNLYVDDILLELSPSCPKPSALGALNVTDASADLTWTQAGTASSWNIEWGTFGFTQGTGNLEVATAIPFNLTGLSPATQYSFYVQADCGGGDLSTWAGPYSFTTACTLVSDIDENFDGVTTPALPNCWRKVGTTGTVNTQATNPASAPNCLYIYGTSATAKAIVALPDVDNAGANTHQLRFNMRASVTVGGIIEVGYLTDRMDANSFVPVTSLTASSLTYNEYIAYLGTAPGAATAIALRHTGVPANSILIDDVKWEPLPSCPKPTNLGVTNVTGDAANLTWMQAGTASTWNIEWGPAGFTQGTGNMEVATAIPFSLTSLTPNTAYAFYVQADCGGDVSEWAGPFNFTTTQIPGNIPFTEDFEGGIGDWTIANGTQVNQWAHGSVVPYNGSYSLYVSNDGGVTNAYTIGTAAVVHAYRDILFTSEPSYNLSFWYKGQGEGSTTYYDYMRVFLIDPATIPTAGTLLSSGQIGNTYNLTPNWTQANINIPGAGVNGLVKRVVFTWRNDASLGTQPPIAIDDIVIESAVGTKDLATIEHINVYPNPTRGIIHVDLGNQKVKRLSVINLLGNNIYSMENSQGLVTIDLSSKATGIYLLKIETNSEVIVKKVKLVH